MKSGIKFEDIEIGDGQEEKSDDSVHVEVHFFLHKGDEINLFEGYPDHRFWIDLKSRDFIPGIRYGIVGMREGGTRNLKISPHLAFGAEGVLDRIPPNAVIICKVKLLQITKDGCPTPNQFAWERQIVATHRGEAARKLPRWNIGIVNDGQYQITVNYPIPGMTWRHTRNRIYNGQLSQEEMDQVFEEIQNFPQAFPNDVVPYECVWADMSEPAGNTPRERSTNCLCIYVSFYKGTSPYASFYVTEENHSFQKTTLYRLISSVLRQQEML
ncbi:MAG: FKBP-type peptidyl-prolyl cis-trans isomerase [Desulfuromonadales bacterium]|nr:FKBP-type peptidyl-prolyl cis-trans isomerase [Desulfuromonadales bacterium]